MSSTSSLSPITQGIKDVARMFGIDLVRYNMYHSADVLLNHIVNHFQVKTILDVGANTGQYAEYAIRHGYSGAIYSFEPIPSVFQKLQEKSKRSKTWIAVNLGVGSREEEIMMNISENFVSSSILKVSEASISADEKTRISHQEKIKITTIDSFMSDKTFEKAILLKLDIQGYEMEALKGALHSLSEVKLVQVELSFAKVYEGGPMYDEVIRLLTGQGFELFTIIPGFRDEKSGRMLQADGIFARP